MKPLKTYRFSVGQGMVMPHLDSFRHTLKTLPKGDYVLIVKDMKEKRSLPQNKLYWLWLTEIASETGSEPSQMHSYLANEYLTVRDSKFPYTRSTSDLDTKEFKEYLDKIELWAKEFLNITLPDPNMLGLLEE